MFGISFSNLSLLVSGSLVVRFLVDNSVLDIALIQSQNLCLLIGELSPFTFRVIIERCLLIPVFLLLFFFQVESMLIILYLWHCSPLAFLIYLVDYEWYFLSSQGSSLYLLIYSFLTSHVCDCFSSSSLWNIPLSIFFDAGLVDINHFSLSLSWTVLISPSILKDSFDGCRILVWQLFSLGAWIILLHSFLAFRVCW
jgi:hypothetical protein